MRTTLTLDEDIATQLAWFRGERKMSLRDVVNTAMRKGLTVMSEDETTGRKPFRTPVLRGGKWLLPDGTIPIDTIRQMDDEAAAEKCK